MRGIIDRQLQRARQPVDQERHADEHAATIGIGEPQKNRGHHQVLFSDFVRADDRPIEKIATERIGGCETHDADGRDHAGIDQRKLAAPQHLADGAQDRHRVAAALLGSQRGRLRTASF
jgi:hypothetical protein